VPFAWQDSMHVVIFKRPTIDFYCSSSSCNCNCKYVRAPAWLAVHHRGLLDSKGGGGGEKGHLKFDCALAVLEWTDLGAPADLEAVPLGVRYNFTQTAFLRSSWAPNASWVSLSRGVLPY
jgi:hypothetical protein